MGWPVLPARQVSELGSESGYRKVGEHVVSRLGIPQVYGKLSCARRFVLDALLVQHHRARKVFILTGARKRVEAFGWEEKPRRGQLSDRSSKITWQKNLDN